MMSHSTSGELHEIPLDSFVVFTRQAQKNNILSLFERQVYPHRLLPNGEAEVPYDVAGWTLPLQMGVETLEAWKIDGLERELSTLKPVTDAASVQKVLDLPQTREPFAKFANPLKSHPKVGLYKPFTAPIDEGWTRLVFDTFQIPYRSLSTSEIKTGVLDENVIVFASESKDSLLNGLKAEDYPAEYAGGLGDIGVEKLKNFVTNGGRIVCFDAACELFIEKFGLPVRNALKGLKRSEFYNPGSIVQLDVNRSQSLAKGIGSNVPAYFASSSAFDVAADAKWSHRPICREKTHCFRAGCWAKNT